MTDLAESPVGDLLAGLATTDDGRAAGVACALTGAVGASLIELTAALAAARIAREGGGDERRMREIAERAGQLRRRLPGVANRDAAAYSEVVAASEGPEREAALERASGPPREVAESAAELSRLAGEVAAAGEWPFTPDAVVAGRLADAAAAGAAALLAANRAGG
jgi:formiminotetrahydrofolate cyclodeaminase